MIQGYPEEPTISVVIPTCDRPGLLAEAVDSVVGQTLPPVQIVVVDNGNEPVSLAPVDADTRVDVIRGFPRMGVAQARNIGAILSIGSHVAFLDDDDAWDAYYLERVCDTFRTTGADIVLGGRRAMESGMLIEAKSRPIDDQHWISA
ncbi:MAG: glycosyltransferase [Gammaproteobacteria bacterium]|nr:glycosyltransferase [Gammaproteobacteria bacterium]